MKPDISAVHNRCASDITMSPTPPHGSHPLPLDIDTEIEPFFKLLPVAAIIIDLHNGQIMEVNKEAESLFGLSRDDFIGLTPADISPEYQPDGRKSSSIVREKLANVARSSAETFFWWHQSSTGRLFPCLVQTSRLPLLGKDLFIAFMTEIADQKEILQDLFDYKHIVEIVENPIAIVDSDFVFRFANPSYCSLFGKTEAEIRGKTVPDIIGRKPFAEFAREKYEQCFGGEPVRYQTWYQVPDLGKRLFDIQYFPYGSIQHDANGVVSCIRDITDIRELEHSLDESEARFRAFMDNLPANVYIKDADDTHIFLNRETARTMGCDVDDLLGKTTHDYFPDDVADKLVRLDEEVLAKGVSRISEEWVFSTGADKSWLRDIKFPIELSSGRKLIGGIALDITEIKRNEDRLETALAEIKQLKDELEKENVILRDELQAISASTEIIGESPALKNCLREAERVAPEQTTVLILGETGTGKELLAQAIHDMSSRGHRAMVKVNCAALPANLIESELFGREKGAYTGAMTRQQGRFELADGSTIFLDEIGDLPLELQSKLLRVLQEGAFEKLGSTTPIRVDVRIIAATNHDLDQLVKDGLFRKDLYYRINVFPITVPPLAERRSDIPLLAYSFIDGFNQSMGKSISMIRQKDLETLQTSDWPGNVRELRNVIERSMILSSGTDLLLKNAVGSAAFDEPDSTMVGTSLADVERNHILKTLESTGWRVSGSKGAAKKLGLKPTTLEARMKKLGLHRPA